MLLLIENIHFNIVVLICFLATFKHFVGTEPLQATSVGERNGTQAYNNFSVPKSNSELDPNEVTLQTMSKLRIYDTLKNKIKMEMESQGELLMTNLTSDLDYPSFDIGNDNDDVNTTTHTSKSREDGISQNKINASYLNESNFDKIHADRNMQNFTLLSHMTGKRRSKKRRFLTNVQSSLKEHIKSGKPAWKMTNKEIKELFDKYYECVGRKLKALKREEFPIKALLAVEGERVEMTCNVWRFLTNVQSSLKEHIKSGKPAWKMTNKEIKELFDKYYKCVGRKLKALKREEFPIKALLAVEGERVEMTCNVCYRPDQLMHTQMAFWQVLRHETSALEDIYPDKRTSISTLHTLMIEEIDVSDAGQYFCLEKRDYAEIYQLDVFLTDKRRSVKLGEDEVLMDSYLLKHNLHVFTMWAPWHECNTCDRPGTKTRVGQCSVKKIYGDIPIFPRDYPLINLYPEGVPCHSTAMPRHLRKLSEIGERESETQVCPCEEVCPTDPPITQVTDETGKVVEVIEAGYHSMKDGPPVLPSIVKRRVLFEPENSHLLLNCPTDAKSHLIRWMRQQREVDPNEIKKLTKGRVWVDSAARMHLKPLLLSDTDVYNCWNKNTRVASIKVIVVNEGNQNIKLYISWAGLAATVIGSLLCMCCICCKKTDKNAQ